MLSITITSITFTGWGRTIINLKQEANSTQFIKENKMNLDWPQVSQHNKAVHEWLKVTKTQKF